MHCVRITIKGFVQGVGFRYFLKQKADELGLIGWVRNTAGGNVEVVVEGKKLHIDQLLAACKEGPPFANVKDVVVKKEEAQADTKVFTIKY